MFRRQCGQCSECVHWTGLQTSFLCGNKISHWNVDFWVMLDHYIWAGVSRFSFNSLYGLRFNSANNPLHNFTKNISRNRIKPGIRRVAWRWTSDMPPSEQMMTQMTLVVWPTSRTHVWFTGYEPEDTVLFTVTVCEVPNHPSYRTHEVWLQMLQTVRQNVPFTDID